MAAGGALGKLNVILGLDYAEFTRGLTRSEYQSKQSMDRIARDAKRAAAAFSGLAVIAGGVMAESIRRSTKEMLDLTTQASRVQMPIEQFTGYAAAAKRADVETSSFTRTVQRLAMAMTSGSDEFGRLGIDVTQLRTTEDALRAVADAMARMPEGAEKVDIARKLMGRAGTDMIGFLSQGAGAIDELVEKQKQLGNVIDDTAAVQLAKYDSAVKDLQDTMHGLRQQTAINMLPAITMIAQAFAEDLAPATDSSRDAFIDWGAAVGSVVATTIDSARSGIFILSDTFKRLGHDIGATAAIIRQFLPGGGGVDGAKAVLEALRETKEGLDRELLSFDPSLFRNRFIDSAGSHAMTIAPRQLGAAQTFGAAGKDPLGAFIDKLEADRAQRIMEAMMGVTDRLADKQRQYQRELDVMGQGQWAASLARELSGIEDKYRDLLEQRRNSIHGLTEEDRQAFREMMEAEKQMATDHFAKLKDVQKDWLLGMTEGLKDYADEASNVYASVSDATRRAFESMTDMLTNFVMTGKMNFKDFANSVISDIIRIQVQRSVSAPLASVLGSVIGGLFPNAKGGVYQSPSLHSYVNQVHDSPQLFTFAKGGVFGEAGPEAIMPLARGPDGSLGVRSTGGGDVSIQIINKGTPQTNVGTPRIDRDAMGRMVVSVMLEDLQRNGPYARNLRGAM